MASFDEVLREAEERRRRRDHEEAASASRAAEALRQLRARAELLVPEVKKAAMALVPMRERFAAKDPWAFRSDGWEVYIGADLNFKIDFQGEVTANFPDSTVPSIELAEFACEGYYSWIRQGTRPDASFENPWSKKCTVQADDALAVLLEKIADLIVEYS